MHGLPACTDLSFLDGRTLLQVCVGLYQVILKFDEDVSISIEGKFKVVQAGKTQRKNKALPLSASVLLRLVGQTIKRVEGEPSGTLFLDFGDGNTLIILDSNREFESYQVVHPIGMVAV